ncbi:glycosyltransferase [Paenibacillus shunpengii]|uniref:Glycosyltransferase n=1 Tax=Paenibacillus shunpengii TaxID=2054424 RepID=A0ABW5STZ8_9BACL
MMMQKKTISLCMIVKNEEGNIRRCLESVIKKVDEIIVVDTGSTDDTLNIVSEFTSNIHTFEWSGDFSSARNYSIQKATSDYILVLDADEFLELNCNLQNDIQSGLDYYLLKIKNELSYGGAFTHSAVRLFANSKGFRYENRLHEHLNIQDENHRFIGGEGKSIIHHIGYTNEVMDGKDKVRRNLSIMLKEVEENPNAYNLFNMGKTYMSAGEYEKAIKYFKKAYPLSSNRVFMPELLCKLAQSLGHLKKFEDALNILHDAVNIYPTDTELRYIQGVLFMDAGYNKDAENTFNKCLELGDQGMMVTEGSGGYLAYYRLAELYEKQKQLGKSFNAIVNVIREKKVYAPGLRRYFDIVSKSNISVEEVKKNIENIYDISSISDLKLLLDVLYGIRHPLLETYMSQYNINVQSNVTASAKQYSGQYNKAKIIWDNMDVIPEENYFDVLLLAIILKDNGLYLRVKEELNFSQKEHKTIKKIVNREDEVSSYLLLTPLIENVLIEFSSKLIILREYDVFEYVSSVLLKGNEKTKIKLCEVLINYNFFEIAIDLLIPLHNSMPNNIKVIELLGDLCLNNNHLDDAIVLYSKLMKISPRYSTLERCYNAYKKVGDSKSIQVIKERIEKNYKYVKWIS